MMSRTLPFLALAFVLSACSSTKPVATIASAPTSGALSVDGTAADWASALQPVQGQPGLSLGVRDDGETMTVVLVANTPEQALRLSRGVTFWFDGAGGTEPGFGVGFPLRPERGGEGRGARGQGANPGAGGQGGDPAARLARTRDRFNEGTRRMAVYRGGGGELQLAVGEVEGIEAASAWTEAALVVELRVPVTGGGNGYTVGGSPGGSVGLGIETVNLQEGALERMRRLGGGGRAGAGGGRRGGAGGGRGGAGGGRGPGADRPQPSTETVWLRVQLAQ